MIVRVEKGNGGRKSDARTGCPAEVGAAVRHVQIDGAGVVVVLQDREQLLKELVEVCVGHLLAPARQPPSAAEATELVSP